MTATPRAPRARGTVTYLLDITNHGPGTATRVELENELLGRATLRAVAASHGSCDSGATLRCSLGQLAAGESAQIRIAATLLSSGVLVNRAVVSAERDAAAENDRAAVRLVVSPRVISAARAGIAVRLVRTQLSAARPRAGGTTRIALVPRKGAFRATRLQLAFDRSRPTAWRRYRPALSFWSRQPVIWIRFADAGTTVTAWQRFRFAPAPARR